VIRAWWSFFTGDLVVPRLIRQKKALKIVDPGLVEFFYRGPGGTPAHPAKEGLKNR
jgi:hypothetical protein